MQEEITRTLTEDPAPQTQTSVNVAHLHPDFELPEPEEDDSPELKAYKLKKVRERLARALCSSSSTEWSEVPTEAAA